MGKSKDGKVSTFIDKESIRFVSENLTRASVKLEYDRGPSLRARKIVSHAIGDEEVDCSQRRTKTREFTLYFTDGDTLMGHASNWKFVIPESSLQNIYDHVCTNGKK